MRLTWCVWIVLGLGFVGPLAAQPALESDLAAGAGSRLTAADIRSLHEDRTVYQINVALNRRFTFWYGSDGVRVFDAGGRRFTGEWAVRDDTRCEETIAGPLVCMTLYRQGDKIWVCDPRQAPQCRWRIERSVDGDPERLRPAK